MTPARFFLTLIFMMLNSLTVQASAQACQQSVKRSFMEIEGHQFSFMAWNMKNVFTYQGKFEREGGMNRMVRAKGPEGDIRPKPIWEVEAARDVLALEMPDFGVLTEIENVFALRRLLELDPRLQGQYHVFLKEGNDPRGIDIAFIVKKSLGFRYKLDTHKNLTWTDRFQKEGKTVEETGPLFSRDLPVLKVYAPGESEPRLIILGNHAKSQRDRDGDLNSSRWRTNQYKGIAQILKSYLEKFPKAAFIFAGDMNTDVRTSQEIAPIRNLIPSVFDLVDADQQIPMEERITHSFFPKDGQPKYSQLDDIRALGLKRIFQAEILPFLDANGNPLPRPRSFKEREKLPSDHSPLKLIFGL